MKVGRNNEYTYIFDTIGAKMRKQRHENEMYERCPVEATLDIIGGKWKGVILMRLLGGKMRFGELQRALCKITQRTLTHQLRELENDGLINREVFAEVPPKVEYSLTVQGKSLSPILFAMAKWGKANLL